MASLTASRNPPGEHAGAPSTSLPLPRAPRRSPKRRFASLRTIGALVLREMTTTYGRSPGGYLWAILEPVAGIALLTAIFAMSFRSPALGDSFPLFYATGMMPFMMFTGIHSKVSQSLSFNRPLLAYPSVTFVDTIIARFVLNFLTQLMVCYIVFTGIFIFSDTNVILDIPTAALGFTLTGALALSIGTLNCFLFTRFKVWQQTWSILMRPMFFISCVFMLFETIPQPFSDYLWWNPLIHVIGCVRRGFYATYDGLYVTPLYVLMLSTICFTFGLMLLRRYHRELISNM